MQDKNLRLVIDDTKIKDIKRNAEGMMNDMIRSSRAYSTSSKEVTKDIEEQIKALEKRNKLDEQQQLLKAKSQLAAGAITKDEFKTQLGAIQTGGGADTLQITVLREILDAIKITSKQEIKEDRQNVERRIRASRTVGTLGVVGDPRRSMIETLQRDMLGEMGESEQTEKARFRRFGRFGRGAAGGFNTASGLATSKSELYAVAGLLGLTPLVGQGMSNLATRFLSAGETAEGSMSDWASANMGMNYSGAAGGWRNIRRSGLGIGLGIDPSTLLRRRAGLRKTMGANMGMDDFMSVMGAEKFIGAGNVDQLAGVSRYGQGDMSRVIKLLEGGQLNTTRLTENISAYVQASNTSLGLSNNINEAGLAKTIMGISTATGQTGRGLNQTVGAIQGLGQTGNPVVKSLMLRAFRETNPNASLFDIQAMMEDPLANMGKGGGAFFENLKKMSGGGDAYKQVLYSTFGGKMSRSRINEILQDGGDFNSIAKEAQAAQEGTINLKSTAEGFTGVGSRSQAKADAVFQELGQKTLELTKNVTETVKKLFDKLNDGEEGDKERNEILNDQRKHLTQIRDNALENAQKAETFWEKAGNYFVVGTTSGNMPK